MSRAMKDSGIPWIGEMLKENGFQSNYFVYICML